MTTGEKLTQLRKQNNITQEELADHLGVSRQSVSKWESDIAYPETEKIIKLSELYHVCVDYLLKDGETEPTKPEQSCTGNCTKNSSDYFNMFNWHFEKKSKIMIGKMPLYHINIGFGRTAKGFFALGNKAMGIFSMGLLSMGVFSMGLLSLGAIVFAVLGLGLISFGSIAIGLISFGAIAVGLFSFGALAIGQFSCGALAIGNYFAVGDHAYGMVAIGKTYAEGTYTASALSEVDYNQAMAILDANCPGIFVFFKWIASMILK